LASDGNDLRAEEAIRIRQATISDAHAIAEIVIRGWQAAYRAILPDDFLAGLSVGAREVAWRMRLESSADGGDPIWVAEVAGVTIGFVSGGPPRDNESPSRAAEIYAIYVDPTSWRRGAGRALLQTATTHLRSLGAEVLVLWVLEENAAGRAFYEALGWRPDGTRQLLDFGGFMVPEVRYGPMP